MAVHSVTPAPGKERQEAQKLKLNLDYIKWVMTRMNYKRPCLKKMQMQVKWFQCYSNGCYISKRETLRCQRSREKTSCRHVDPFPSWRETLAHLRELMTKNEEESKVQRSRQLPPSVIHVLAPKVSVLQRLGSQKLYLGWRDNLVCKVLAIDTWSQPQDLCSRGKVKWMWWHICNASTTEAETVTSLELAVRPA